MLRNIARKLTPEETIYIKNKFKIKKNYEHYIWCYGFPLYFISAIITQFILAFKE